MSNAVLISAGQLHEKMNSGKDVLILDVRNMDEFNNWKIEGKKVKSINVPYFNFLEEDESNFKELPKDEEMVVVCAKGGSAQFVAETLAEKGYKTSVLDGGMLAWSQFYHPTVVAFDEKMKLIQINRFSKGCLSYAIISEGKGMIIDANQKVEYYLDFAKQYNFKIEHIVDSHLHADHISGGPALAEQTGATYYISSGEVKGTDLKYEPLEQYQSIRFGEVEVEVLAVPTPGHTPGSTSFLLNNQFLMSGDTIFVGGLGRPDLGGKAKEWAQDLYDTVFHKVSQLSDDVLVLPAHYADIKEINDNGIVGATLGEIRKSNDIMRNEDREAFTQQVAGAVSTEKPPNFEEIIAINRGELHVEPERAVELEIGPNRCAVHHH
ncbi:MBL fold metallo-hydrolase [Paenibacillus chondroitinus]|uniref:MBL fold metallo-hydrolase n=1 Tax=Paenibacillus chondroitinus TaxID=59842 RepID=A0ABU6DKX6_9BACL|nr:MULTISPECIES: MBL fold metallo-hydrolase [Paenibacillus]MCY9657149.1 MBL fold metallo-hydrolase [Paenibacillus anseongense]MEB4798432.1 MBL fold metallo-hydrolase [Paenibacillus chondroitinus]